MVLNTGPLDLESSAFCYLCYFLPKISICPDRNPVILLLIQTVEHIPSECNISCMAIPRVQHIFPREMEFFRPGTYPTIDEQLKKIINCLHVTN